MQQTHMVQESIEEVNPNLSNKLGWHNKIYKSFMLLRKVSAIIDANTTRRLQYGKIHSLREAFQEGKAKDRPSQAADLGRAESRHKEAGCADFAGNKETLEAFIPAKKAGLIDVNCQALQMGYDF